jgi:hypothetical protein
MAYSKPYTYVAGTVLSGSDALADAKKAKVYNNQEIITADISTGKFDFDEICTGEMLSQVVEGSIVGLLDNSIPTFQ